MAKKSKKKKKPLQPAGAQKAEVLHEEQTEPPVPTEPEQTEPAVPVEAEQAEFPTPMEAEQTEATAEAAAPETTVKEKSPLWMIAKWVMIIALLASLLLNLATYVFPVVRHYGSSMRPTLSENQLLLMHKTDAVERGDVIAFYYNNNVMVRRVIAGPGDTVSVDIFGQVTVNNEVVEERYIAVPALGQTDLQYPYIVPANSFFVMGDAREIAMDSRLSDIGPVPRDRIVGKLIFSLSPFGSIKTR